MSIFEQNSERHKYDTHQRSDIQSMFCITDIFIQSVNNMGIKQYHNLPCHLKTLKNMQFLEGN
jgi:hypothetical protein